MYSSSSLRQKQACKDKHYMSVFTEQSLFELLVYTVYLMVSSPQAAYLQKSGLDVCVLERRHVIGGAAVTEEIIPGKN